MKDCGWTGRTSTAIVATFTRACGRGQNWPLILKNISKHGSIGIEKSVLNTSSWWAEAPAEQHQRARGGFRKTALITLSELIDCTPRPRIKLH